jgi:hypothetical protein
MLPRQIALISESAQIPFNQVVQISAALQRQITRDFSPIWEIQASIDPFDKLEAVPAGYWPILIKDKLDNPRVAGFHLDQHGQPFSLVLAGPAVSLDCSHELMEMLVDPFGNRLVAGDSPNPEQGRVNFLMEVCDPCQNQKFGYPINGTLVSDFYTPHYFDPVAGSGVRYSYTSAIKGPRQILPGGYLTWIDHETGLTWQVNDPGQTHFVNLGKIPLNGRSYRAMVDRLSHTPRTKPAKPSRKTALTGLHPESSKWAERLRESISAVDTTVSVDYTVTFYGGDGWIQFDSTSLPSSPIKKVFDKLNNPDKFSIDQSDGYHAITVTGIVPAGVGGKITVDVSLQGKTLTSYSNSNAGPIVGDNIYYDTQS